MINLIALPLVLWLKPVIPPAYFLEPPGLAIPKDCELMAQLPNLLPVINQEQDKNVQCDDVPETGLRDN